MSESNEMIGCHSLTKKPIRKNHTASVEKRLYGVFFFLLHMNPVSARRKISDYDFLNGGPQQLIY